MASYERVTPVGDSSYEVGALTRFQVSSLTEPKSVRSPPPPLPQTTSRGGVIESLVRRGLGLRGLVVDFRLGVEGAGSRVAEFEGLEFRIWGLGFEV